MSESEAQASAPILIKKYANRRLYNTATSSYVTLDSLCQMVKGNVDFVVRDAKTGEDITRSVLTQIIFEEEGKGQNLLPINFLRQIIGLYGDRFQALIPRYLEASMDAFARNQTAMQRYLERSSEGFNPFAPIEELGRQNMALFTKALTMFTAAPENQGEPDPSAASPGPGRNGNAAETGSSEPASGDLKAVRTQLSALEKQLARLEKKGKE